MATQLILLLTFLCSTCNGIPSPGGYSDAVRSGGTEIKADIKDIHFYLHTRANTAAEELFLTPESITGSHFDKSRDKTIFITHGFSDNTEGWVSEMKDLFLTDGDHNIILIDWREHAVAPWYFESVANVPIVANQSSLLLKALVDYAGLDSERVTMTGHSLGAHVVGDAGMFSQNLHGLSMGRIVAMDPAGPEFHTDDLDARLDASDADFVVVIHTNGGSLLDGCVGHYDPCGHVDFYTNGGAHQPGCTDLGDLWDLITGGCSHMKSGKYMIEGILKPTGFMGTQCESYEEYLAGNCDGNTQTPMGYHTDNSVAGGKFYLTTNENPPYSH